jgi:hypothetical protein
LIFAFAVIVLCLSSIDTILCSNSSPSFPKRKFLQKIQNGIQHIIYLQIGALQIANAKISQSELLIDLPRYSKRVFNIPPSPFIYPEYMNGYWTADYYFTGTEFSSRYPAELLAKNTNIAGFRKYGVLATPDVGYNPKEIPLHFCLQKSVNGCYEDRISNVASTFSRFIPGANVEEVVYDGDANPNRFSLSFSDTKGTGNIELFVNSRQFETLSVSEGFRTIEHCRQSTVRALKGQKASQIITDYAIETVIERKSASDLNGVIRILPYFSPQDPEFFDRPSLPVACFSYSLQLSKIA